jgi:acyl-CoA synthetase (AMP-forming)/AMP-acid ligase II
MTAAAQTGERVFNLADLFEIVVDAVPDREALVAGEVRLTYFALEERANRLAHVLADAGIAPGDSVAIYSWNRAEWVEAWWAIFKIRAVPINVNYRYVGEELRYILDNADAKAIIHEREFAGVLREIAPELPQVLLTLEMGEPYERALAAAAPERDFGPRSPGDIYMLYTGGTTGAPKGVMWRQEDIFFAAMGGNGFGSAQPIAYPAQVGERAIANGGIFRNLVLPPLMHGAAQWGGCNAITGFFGGGTMILSSGHSFDPHAAWELAEREKVTGIAVVGDAMARPLVEALADHSVADREAGGRYALDSLLTFGSGGAILSPTIKSRLREYLPNLIVSDAYGASETGAGGSPAEGAGSSPRFHLTPEVTVLDDELKPVAAGSGVIGRLARRGHIPLGYYKDKAKTATTFLIAADGIRYVIPGDYATVEDDGNITLLGRGSQCINTGGEKVYPEEVEVVLKEHPEVYDALVVGVPDERFGERIAAIVQPREGTAPTLEALQAMCRTKLAGYKAPRQLVLVDEMPRSPAGKADYRRAKAMATAVAVPRGQ